MNDAMVRGPIRRRGRLSVLLGDTILTDSAPIVVESTVCRCRRGTTPGRRRRISGYLTGTRVHAAWARAASPTSRVGVHPHAPQRRRGSVAITRMDPLKLHVRDDWRVLGYRSAWGMNSDPSTGWTFHDVILEAAPAARATAATPTSASSGTMPRSRCSRLERQLAHPLARRGARHRRDQPVAVPRRPRARRADRGAERRRPSVAAIPSTTPPSPCNRAVVPPGCRAPRGPTSCPSSGTTGWPYEDVEVTEQIIAENAKMAGDLGFGVVTVDAGWFGASDAGSDWQEQRGDWPASTTARFPSRLGALGDSIRAGGLEAGMWIEAEPWVARRCSAANTPRAAPLSRTASAPTRPIGS